MDDEVGAVSGVEAQDTGKAGVGGTVVSPPPAVPSVSSLAPPPARIVDAVLMLMGDTGSGKSTLMATYADWVWKTYRKVTYYYLFDLGGVPTEIMVLVQKGIIRLWKARLRTGSGLALDTMHKATLGHWPKVWNPATGESAPDVELVAPRGSVFVAKCPLGHEIIRTKIKAMVKATLCRKCSPPKMVSLTDMQVSEQVLISPGFADRGAAIFDGISSMSDIVMRDLAERAAAGDIKGTGQLIKSGDMQYAGNNEGHYGFAQNRTSEWFANAISIPGLVIWPAFTALELRIAGDAETNAGLPFYGPQIAGRAMTGKIPQLVGNCLGTAVGVNKDKGGKSEHRLYLKEYRQDDNIPHKVKTRVGPGHLPEYLTDGPIGAGEVELSFKDFSLGRFMELYDAAMAQISARTDAKYGGDTPGLPSGTMEVEGGKTTKDEQGKGTGVQPGQSVSGVAASIVPGRNVQAAAASTSSVPGTASTPVKPAVAPASTGSNITAGSTSSNGPSATTPPKPNPAVAPVGIPRVGLPGPKKMGG